MATSFPAGNAFPTTAPISGVITRIRIRSNSVDTGTLRLASSNGAGQFTGAGTGATYTTVGNDTIEEYAARLPVTAGEYLAADTTSTTAYNCANGVHGAIFVPTLDDGGPFRSPTGVGCEILGNAVIEADADGDDFGDETQDECLGEAGSVNGCVPENEPGDQSTLTGVITGSTGKLIGGAWISVCNDNFTACRFDQSNSSGGYTMTGLPAGTYSGTVHSPNGANGDGIFGPVAVSGADGAVFTENVKLAPGPQPPPPDTQIGNGSSPDGIPVLFRNRPFEISTQGCEGGSGSYEITVNGNAVASGNLTEGPVGTYSATNPGPSGTGDAVVTVTISGCPDPGDDEADTFNIYIDPSGVISNQNTEEPIEGATATLVRSDVEAGPFVTVPNGSDIMSPSNRVNPGTTEADGKFAWDVIPGFYKVLATAPGCLPGETEVLPVPPIQLDLEIELVCEPPAPTVSSSSPASGANDNNPKVIGTAEANSTVKLYTNNTCTSAVAATGTAADFASPGLTVTVANNSTTTFFATAQNAAGISTCSPTSVSYTETTPPPPAPTLTGSAPLSGSNNNSPKITGGAVAGSTVRLYTNNTCTSAVAATGTAADFASPGLTVTVANNSTTTFFATAQNADGTSTCSTSSFTYQEVTPPRS